MDDILFRGRRKDNGEWIEGYYLGNSYDKYIVESYAGKEYIIEPYTLSQYIGLMDKNGKKIFNGDILQNDQLPYMVNGRSVYFHEVVWLDDVAAFGLYVHKNPKSRVNGLSHGEMQYIENFDASEWEVVGNIHDNSDMLL